MNRQPITVLLAMVILVGCDASSSPKSETAKGSASSVKAPTERIPTKEEVVKTALGFALAYLESNKMGAELEGYLAFLKPEAKYYTETNEWGVFLTNGVGSINVVMDRTATTGSIHRSNGTAFTNNPDMKGKIHPEPIPLFTLSEFREVLKDYASERESNE